MGVLVVIPVHNETESIELLPLKVGSALTPESYFEIVVVDDGSRDNTAQILNDQKQTIKTLRVIRHKSFYGQCTVLMTGPRAAVSLHSTVMNRMIQRTCRG